MEARARRNRGRAPSRHREDRPLGLQSGVGAHELLTAREELTCRERLAALTALGEMSAVIAHEVRNPVAVILNATAAMRRNPDARDTLLGIVDQEAARLQRMVIDLLDFARPATTHLVEEPLGPIIESALESVRRNMGQATFDVDLVLDEHLPPFSCDVRLLRQALVNIVTNAIEAPGRTSPVRIGATTTQDGHLRITVVDDGAGVCEADAERIFSPFFTTRATGTGLGLAVAQRIVAAHDGTLLLRPTPGRGATFEITLPPVSRRVVSDAPRT